MFSCVFLGVFIEARIHFTFSRSMPRTTLWPYLNYFVSQCLIIQSMRLMPTKTSVSYSKRLIACFEKDWCEHLWGSLTGPISRVTLWNVKGKRCYYWLELLMIGGKESCLSLFSVTYCIGSLAILVPGTTVKTRE